MARPQPGIFAQGTRSHYHLEFDLRPDATDDAIAAALRGLREPSVTSGGSNIVVGFGPTLWRRLRPDDAPDTLVPFTAIDGPDRHAPATQHDLWVWTHGTGEDVELEKSVIKKIADPLTHLVSNAIDHGIETPQEIADFLRAFTEGIRGLPMAEKKARIRSVIGRLTHNHLPPSEGPESALASCTEGRFRTSRILVMTRINSKPPESADSGGLSAESHNQMASGSGREVVGSAGRIRTCDLKVMSLASYRTAPPRVHLQWTISIAMPNTRVKPFRMPKRILTPLPKAPCGTRSRQLSTSEWGYPPGYPQLSTAGGPRNPRWKRSTCNPRARPTAVLHPSALDNPGRLSTATGCASDAEKTLCRPY